MADAGKVDGGTGEMKHIPYGNQVCFMCNKEFVRRKCIASK